MNTATLPMIIALLASYKNHTNKNLTDDDILTRAKTLNELMESNLTPTQLQSIAQAVWDTLFYVDTMD